MARTARAMNSIYAETPLMHGRSIRLITLNGDACSGIICRMSIHNVDDPDCPPWIALSYTWDKSEFSTTSWEWQPSARRERKICVNGNQFPIRENLWLFLCELRRQGNLPEGSEASTLSGFSQDSRAREGLLYWADAICINQQDIDERSSQINLMSLIFSKALKVIGWLTPISTSPSEECEAMIVGLCNQRRTILIDQTQEHRSSDPTLLMHIQGIFGNPYWGRMWILQEVILAQQITFLYGDLVMTDMERMSLSFTAFDLGKYPVYSVLANRKLFGRLEGSVDRGLPLESLLAASRHKLCADIRDRIFAILGLLRQEYYIDADYSASPHQVFGLVVIAECGRLRRRNLHQPDNIHIKRIAQLCAEALGLDIASSLEGFLDVIERSLPGSRYSRPYYEQFGLWLISQSRGRHILEARDWMEIGIEKWFETGSGQEVRRLFEASSSITRPSAERRVLLDDGGWIAIRDFDVTLLDRG